MATKEERALTRRLFNCKVVLSNATAFQALFWDVMKAKYGDSFATVAPQGQLGDGGNDGYLPQSHHYFQTYSPTNPNDKKVAAATKSVSDFHKLLKSWPDLLAYSFVFNDKYQGAPKEVEQKLSELRKENGRIKIAQYCARELEDDFMSLPESKWDQILGEPLPDVDRLKGLDYGVLRDVVAFIMGSDIDDVPVRMTIPPELDEKIKLNGLLSRNRAIIERGALLTGHMEKFFHANSSFALEELRDHVVGHYNAARTASSDSSVDANDVFDVFRRSLCPVAATEAKMSAVDAVIGYFFEACDIFEPPTQGSVGASSQ